MGFVDNTNSLTGLNLPNFQNSVYDYLNSNPGIAVARQMKQMQEAMMPWYARDDLFRRMEKTARGLDGPSVSNVLAKADLVSWNLEKLVPRHYISLQKLATLSNLGFNLPHSTASIIAEKLATPIRGLTAFNYEIEVPKEESEQAIKVVDSAKAILQDIYLNNDLLDKLHHRKFEEIITELMYSKGFEVELTKQTNDGGKDIIAFKKSGYFPLKFLIECKRWNRERKMDIKEVRSFCHVISRDQPNMGIMCATTYFTKGCMKEAASMGSLIELKNYDDIIQWVIDYNLSRS